MSTSNLSAARIAELVKSDIVLALDELSALTVEELLARRLEKYRCMGEYKE